MYFILYSHNVLVNGLEKAAIYDLESGKILYIPLAFSNLLDAMQSETITEIQQRYVPNNPKIIQDYIQLLLDNDLGFYTQDPGLFPKLDSNYFSPTHIEHAVLMTDLEHYDLSLVLNKLDAIGCQYIEIRLFLRKTRQFEEFCELLMRFNAAGFNSILLVMQYEPYLSNVILKQLLQNSPKIERIIVHTAHKNVAVQDDLIFKKETLAELEHKSFSASKLILNMKYYQESLKYNTTYNRKLAIDRYGDIKNIVYDSEIFGNINSDNLEGVVGSSEFQKLWEVSPDHIEDLKDSPLRYVLFNPYPIVHHQNKYIINKEITFTEYVK